MSPQGVEAPPTGLIEVLRAEITALKGRTADMEKECKRKNSYGEGTVHELICPPVLDLNKMQQCNKYKSELVQFRKQHDLPTDDIPLDEG